MTNMQKIEKTCQAEKAWQEFMKQEYNENRPTIAQVREYMKNCKPAPEENFVIRALRKIKKAYQIVVPKWLRIALYAPIYLVLTRK